MRVYKCGCAASLEWCQNTKSHADMKNSWREMLLQWAYQKSHYHHVQCVYCKIWIFIMLLGRRYFELSPPSLTQCLFVCFTPFKFDLGQRITTDTHSRRESRLCANSSPILYHSILIRQRWLRRRRRRVNFYLLFSSFWMHTCFTTLEGFELSWDESSFPAITMQNVCTEAFVSI